MKIAMVGTGYVGLVSGVCFSDFGHEVVCVDKNPDNISRLQSGEVPIFEPRYCQIWCLRAFGHAAIWLGWVSILSLNLMRLMTLAR